MPKVTIIGIDLSGPSNAKDTAVVVAEGNATELRVVESRCGASDAEILVHVRRAARPLVVALDAPLSYQDGGGDRPADRELRKRIVAAGMRSGSVMTPTMTRMAYLTLRGIAVARLVAGAGGSDVRVVEVHPGASMALRGAPIDAVRSFRADPAAGARLLEWLGTQGVIGLRAETTVRSHEVAAAAAVLAGWRWSIDRAAWCWPAEGPMHPFDFAC